MLEHLSELVGIETPSSEPRAAAAGIDLVDELCTRLLGSAGTRVVVDEREHLVWRGGGPTRVLVLGHVDTVWPLGTTARWPFEVSAGRASGPGAFDMKAGLVQGLHALSLLDDLAGVTVLVNTDEEIGSPSSRALIEAEAAGAHAALVLEPSAAGALKSARKGISMYELVVTGRAAHAGLEPEKGVNAALEIASLLLRVADLARPDAGSTVTPTLVAAGTTANTVPALARASIDVRVADLAEQQRVDQQLRSLACADPAARLEVRGGPNRPPLPASASLELFARAQSLAGELGLPPLQHVAVGGGSDGNFTAGVGVATLDGLGAVGDGAHAEGEYIDVSAMGSRAALVSCLVADLLA
ncbi:MAG: glutamate carboxypeptidase [Actinomycetota bacterium]|nr:glutamate carboxypeptidase [Actinomycetota bacterium]